MKPAGTLHVAARGDLELVMTREFDAPRELVYDAYTRPELIRRWLLGPPGWTMPVCEVDLRVGGRYRFVWRKAEQDMGMGGEYREIVSNERIVNTEVFDDPWFPGEAVGTLELVERGGRTLMTHAVRYDSREIRDGVLKSPMEQGVAASYDRLDGVLASMARG